MAVCIQVESERKSLELKLESEAQRRISTNLPKQFHFFPKFDIVWFGIRLERWSIFHGDGMAMVAFLQPWNGDGFENFSLSPLMVFGRINHW